MASSYRNHFALIPLPVQDALGPPRGRHQAALLRRKIDAGFVPDAEVAGVVGEAVNANTQTDIVEKNVAGLQNRPMKVGNAVGLRSRLGVVNPAMVLPAEEVGITGAISCKALLGNMVFQHGRGGDNLEDGAWCELGLDGPIQQRLVGILVQSLPFIRGDAHRKIVGV